MPRRAQMRGWGTDTSLQRGHEPCRVWAMRRVIHLLYTCYRPAINL